MSHEILLEALRRGPAMLRELMQAVPPEAMERRRGEGLWTLRQHLEHLVAVQPMLYGRLDSFLREEQPRIKPYLPGRGEQPGSERGKSSAELLEQFESWRLRQIELIASAPPEVWRRRAVHPEYESYGFEILVRHIALHDGTHLYRMEELWLMTDEALASD